MGTAFFKTQGADSRAPTKPQLFIETLNCPRGPHEQLLKDGSTNDRQGIDFSKEKDG